MSEHTPGPWFIDEKFVGPSLTAPVCVFEEYTGAIYETFDNWEANARLIAAAPEMHAALERARSALMWIINYDSDDKVLAKAINGINAALAKAEPPVVERDLTKMEASNG